MKNKTLQTCIGASMIILSLGFLIRSFSSANAAPYPQQGNDHGKFQMAVVNNPNTGSSISLYILMWNTETGDSKMFTYEPSFGYSGRFSQTPSQLRINLKSCGALK